MYNDTITLFNHYKSRLGDVWYPTVISGVNLNKDKAAIAAKFGFESNDRVVLNIRYFGEKNIAGKKYLDPMEWSNQTNNLLPSSITFKSGVDFDFFVEGDRGYTEPIMDDDYIDGFYNYMRNQYDNVFAVTSVAEYSVIPHFEIMGA